MSSEEQNGKLRKVAWSELFPWLILARCFRIAIQLRLLFLGAVGIFLMIAGWTILGFIFSGNQGAKIETRGYGAYPWLPVTQEIGGWPRGLALDARGGAGEAAKAKRPSLLRRGEKPGWGSFAGWQGSFWAAWEPLWSTWEHLSRPFCRVFGWKGDYLGTLEAYKPYLEHLRALNQQNVLDLKEQAQDLEKEAQDPEKTEDVKQKAEKVKGKLRDAEQESQDLDKESQDLDKTLDPTKTRVGGVVVWVAFLFLCGLWALAVWAFFGGAISRAASIELATGDRAKLFRSLNFAASKWASYFAAPLIPLVGAILIALPLALGGLFLYWGGVGTFLAGLGWPLALLGGFLMALLLLGLVFGWPLFWANLSTEGVDSFDAVGRTYDYVYHRPLNYLFYAIVAALIGALGWLVVANFFEGIVGATYWAVSWGSTETEVLAVAQAAPTLGPVEKAGAWLIRFWVQCVKFLGVGFLYSYIWVAGSAIYLLLRRDVDATEMDEVLPEEEVEQQPAPLPDVTSDAAGAPAVGETPPPPPEPKPEEPPPAPDQPPAQPGEQPPPPA